MIEIKSNSSEYGLSTQQRICYNVFVFSYRTIIKSIFGFNLRSAFYLVIKIIEYGRNDFDVYECGYNDKVLFNYRMEILQI